MSFFQNLHPDLQQTLQSHGTRRSLNTGEYLIKKGDCDTTLYVLQSGSLQVVVEGDEQPLTREIHPGDVIGELAFLDNRPRTASVVITSPCEVMAFERESTFQQFSDKPLALGELIGKLASLQQSRLKEDATTDTRNHQQFVDDLAREALEHRAVQHPYLKALGSGELPNTQAALADFAHHYYGYSAHFPRYLTALISKLEKPAHRTALLENLTEESGQYEQEELDELKEFGVQSEWIVGIPHPQLFQRFRQALGVRNTDAADDHIEVVCWRELFISILTNGTAAEALGALGIGTETIVQTIYQPFVDAIQRLGTIAPEDAVFFPLHTAVDDHHQATLRDIAIDFAATAEGRADLARGTRKALALRASFWSWLLERAQAQPAAA